jgi:hypothetical protein
VKIIVTRNGPYVVIGEAPLTSEEVRNDDDGNIKEEMVDGHQTFPGHDVAPGLAPVAGKYAMQNILKPQPGEQRSL